MKIAYDYKIFWNQKYGGISRYFTNLFYEFDKQKVNYKVFAPFHKNLYLSKLKNTKVVGTYIKDNIPFTSNLIKFYNENFSIFNTNKWKPDLVHYTYYYNRIRKQHSSIITVYDLIHEITSKNKNIKPKQKMIDISDHIICISNNTKNDLLNFYEVDEKKISVIYLGGNHLNNLENLPSAKFTNSKPFILYVGSREKYKNFEFFIKGYSKSKRLSSEVDIVLFGGGKLNKKEKELINKLDIDENRVIQINGSDIILKSLYKKAKAFVFPSLYEGFGLPILEAIENNCPIVCSDIPIFREILDDNAFFFDLKSYESLILSLEKAVFLNDQNKMINGYKLLKNKFTWEECSLNTLKLYKEIAG